MAYSERLEPLTKENRAEIRKNIYGVAVFSVIAGAVFYFMYSSISETGSDIFQYVMLFFAIFFLGIIGYIAGAAVMDLSGGQKTIITGEVTDKEMYKRRSSKNSSSSQPSYYVFFDDKKVSVEVKHYNKIQVGNEIELHYAKWSKKSLGFEMLNGGTAAETEEKTTEKLSAIDRLKQRKAEREAVEKKEYPLTAEDLQVLVRKRNSKVMTNILIFFFFLLFAVAFGLASLAEWFFIIPEIIFLIVLYFSVKWTFRCFSKYRKDKEEGMKLVTIDNVKDKETNNRSGRKSYTLSTVTGSFPVEKEIYDKIEIGDQLLSFTGKNSGWLIGYHTDLSGYIGE